MSAIDMATLGILSLALLLQMFAGLIPILYEDLNPAKGFADEADPVLSAPRSIPLYLFLQQGKSGDDRPEGDFLDAFAQSDDAQVLTITSELLAALTYQISRERGFFGIRPGLFHKWYTRRARILLSQDVQDLRFDEELQFVDRNSELVQSLKDFPRRDRIIYCSLWRPFGRQDWELFAYRKVWQRSSLLLLAVAALVRFAYGEPILNLF